VNATARTPPPGPCGRGSASRLSRWLLGFGLAIGGATGERPDWSSLLRQPPEWFRSAEGRRIAANILSFQTERGDWPKNTDTAGAAFTGDRSALRGTFDNGATVNELRFLARAHRATGEASVADAVRQGLEHVLAAQYPSGGWPQSHPPGTGYARHITFNDGAMVNVMTLLRAVAGDAEFAFLDADLRRRAEMAFDRGVACILRCQVVVDGRLTVWAAQHDAVTFEPRPARAFEPAALSAGESAGVLRLLMSLPEPSPAVQRAIRAGAAWFEAARLTGIRQVRENGDRVIRPDPAAPPLWARFYEPGSNRPVFAGRDGVVKYRLADIEPERRAGYAWYGDWGAAVARDFARWCETR
jgi:pectate lyase